MLISLKDINGKFICFNSKLVTLISELEEKKAYNVYVKTNNYFVINYETLIKLVNKKVLNIKYIDELIIDETIRKKINNAYLEFQKNLLKNKGKTNDEPEAPNSNL